MAWGHGRRERRQQERAIGLSPVFVHVCCLPQPRPSPSVAYFAPTIVAS